MVLNVATNANSLDMVKFQVVKPHKSVGSVGNVHTSSLLGIQRQLHEESPYKYNDCEKSFKQHSDFLKHHRFHTGRNPMNVKNVGRTSVRALAWLNTRGHTPEKSHTHIPNVGTASDRAHISVGINKFI